ncbi:hypothetical protein M8818_005942 [Zalaria obscura]|uniref:Uncharacterized protein n=1 Tax=Zalaria obscura TaxID=2024903 RepID=A0ACC3S6G3_9PEZI
MAAAGFTSLNGAAPSTSSLAPSTAPTGTKRKRAELKFYAVRTGHEPGIYHSWTECLDQVRGYKGAIFKSFPSLTEAESFIKSDGTGPSRSGVQKYYAVQNGRVPGVYTDWQSASEQIRGWTKPKHKAFTTRAEAEAFVYAGGNVDGAFGSPIGSGAGTPSGNAAKKQKKKAGKGDSHAPSEEPGDYEPGEGPLPPDTEDGFDPRITLNPATGKIEYKTAEQARATKWHASGPADTGMLRIYTDGSALGNGGNGAIAGVGVYFGPNDSRNVSEPLKGERQTNQRAELTAILRALELAPRDRPVTIYSDSSYAIKCVTEWFQKWRSNGWLNSSKKPVENKDLIEKVLALLEERERIGRAAGDDVSEGKGRSRVQFVWVKGHKDDPGNIAADGLAVAGAKEAKEMAGQY